MMIEESSHRHSSDLLEGGRAKRRRVTSSGNPLQIKPEGNLLYNPKHRLTRVNGLGKLSILPDEILLGSIFSDLNGEDLLQAQAVSKAFYAWCHVEGIWKGIYITKSSGRLKPWHGSWRSSYIFTFLQPSDILKDLNLNTSPITTPTLHSDILFQPCLCANFDPCKIFNSSSIRLSVKRLKGGGVRPDELPDYPVILTGLMSEWGAMRKTTRRWTLPLLAKRFPSTLFRAEATLTTLPDYQLYHDYCAMDESPLYLFESEFVEKTREDDKGGLGSDFEVPLCFREDFFDVMGKERPDFRWLIAGPLRSGSTWHQDPNGTSAWNAVTTGRKAWVMFPPDVTPPGVYVSEDRAHVEAPLSLAEWFLSYYKEAKTQYGPDAKDDNKRGKMLEGICETGEIFYVPSGWWHIVINLEDSIAVTQNFVSRRELPSVLRFMHDRPSQVSGFKIRSGQDELTVNGIDDCDDIVPGVYEAFYSRLKRERPEIMLEMESLLQCDLKENGTTALPPSLSRNSMWNQVKGQTIGGPAGETFVFGFTEDEVEYVENEELI